MSRLRSAAAALAALLLAAPAGPAGAQEAGEISYESYTLDNGLQVILSEDHSTPIVTVDLWYGVGSSDEPEGRFGFAHLFEHMMFQGSEHVEKNEYFDYVESVGGNLNGSTSEDRTNYYQTLPANRLNLALWLEADRMRALDVTQENFENQRSTVKEERRQSFDNSPYGRAFLTGVWHVPYRDVGCPGYAHSPIGPMEDLNAATAEDAREFYETYYVPNNATLAVVGDFEPERAKEMIERYFGGIPSGEVPSGPPCDVDYTPGMRVDTVEDPNANLPAVVWSFRIPPAAHEDNPPLQLLANVFGQGESSRLYRSIVDEAGAAQQMSSQLYSRKGPGLFLVLAFANQGITPDSLRGLFQQELRRLHEEPPTEEELEKAKNSFEADHVQGRQSTFEKAEALLRFAQFHPDLSDVNRQLDRYLSVTREDLRRVVDRYLTEKNLSVVIDQPVEAADDGGSDDAEQEGADR